LEVEPLDKAVDPVIGGEILLVHAEAVTALFTCGVRQALSY